MDYAICTRFEQRYRPHAVLTTIFRKSHEYIKTIYSLKNNYACVVYGSISEAINIIYNSYWFNGNKVRILTCVNSNHSLIAPIYGRPNCFSLNVIDLDPDFIPNVRQYLWTMTNDISLVVLTHMSNVINMLIPIRLYVFIKRSNTTFVVDGTQVAPHLDVNIGSINCDVYLISTNKMYTFPSIGLCFVKTKLLNNLNQLALEYRGIHQLSLHPFSRILNTTSITYGSCSSSNFGMTSLAEVLKWKRRFNSNHEEHICKYLWYKLSLIPSVHLMGRWYPGSRTLCFKMKGIPSYEVSKYLNELSINGQSGYHYSIPLIEYLKIGSVYMVSIGLYNTYKDADALIYNVIYLWKLNEFCVRSHINMVTLNRIINISGLQSCFDPEAISNRLMLSRSKHFNRHVNNHVRNVTKCNFKVSTTCSRSHRTWELT
ncbi:Cysteine desulfurase [Candidatus Hodgkinia cicadicola]|uniref:Cysteine desulfurase n=2 Tax=Candidatus Hodgkinia cicadicola TaxID=573658 RepID=A0ABX4MJP8_9HYPH|nr:Cysteine desulfurase [Candidatus Hodgkinia cicadicola]PIM96068.1 Cysteine desulfurase [Candidatus Hodgkinia cicadicola]PIM96280.1 Cysteine desulfurase [Candidatus Hodgkinia cicadicola]